uniref:Uncharacterized protein n=1 Tax=Acrobeloides nanus TaxID=290746 RepID=A0A914CVP4_9BILA
MEISIYNDDSLLEVEEQFSPTQLNLNPSSATFTSPNFIVILLLASFVIIISITFIAYQRMKTIKHRKGYDQWTP